LVSTFIKEFIATGIFDKKFSRLIKNAQKIRLESDYEDFYIISRDTTKEQIVQAEKGHPAAGCPFF
jgi:uncharacterized protein (UPF0332 family)